MFLSLIGASTDTDLTPHDRSAILSFVASEPAWLNEDQLYILELFAENLSRSRQDFAVASPGFGKTRVHIGLAAALTSHFAQHRNRLFVWITINNRTIISHKKELQGLLPDRFPDETIAVISGESFAELTPQTRIVIITPGMFQKIMHGEIQHNLPNFLRPDTVLMRDEVHVTLTAKRHTAVQKLLGLNCLDLGITATPAFSDGRTVSEISYNNNPPFYILPTRTAVQKGYNCQIGMSIYDVQISVDKGAIRAAHRDLSPNQLNTLIRQKTSEASLEARIKAMVASWGSDVNPYNGRRLFCSKTIDFLPDVESAKKAAIQYNEMYGHLVPEGKIVAAAVYTKGMSSTERKDIMEAHKRGDIYVLTNVRCLSTAHNDPEVENVSIVWETQSELLLQQEIGRAFRFNPADPDKFAYLRQWIDLQNNPQAVLVTEALDSYEPLTRFSFTPASGKETEPPITRQFGDISYTMLTKPKQLESITKIARFRRDPKLLLPLAPPEFLNISQVSEIVKGSASWLKARESAFLRQLFSMVDKSFRAQAEYSDNISEVTVTVKEGEELKITAVYGGTLQGNMLHIKIDDLKLLFLSYKKEISDEFHLISYNPNPGGPVSTGDYITTQEAERLIGRISAQAATQLSQTEIDGIIKYLKACPADKEKTPLGISTRHNISNDGIADNIAIHAKELGHYIIQRLQQLPGNEEADVTIARLYCEYEDTYADLDILSAPMSKESLKNFFEATGFKTNNKAFDNLALIFETISERILDNTLLPTEKKGGFGIIIYVDGGEIIASVEGERGEGFVARFRESSNGKLKADQTNYLVLPNSRVIESSLIFETNFQPDVVNCDKVFMDYSGLPYYLNEFRKRGHTHFSEITYTPARHKETANSLPHFLAINEPSVEAFLQKHGLTPDEGVIESFVKHIRKAAKNLHQEIHGSCPPKGQDKLPSFIYDESNDGFHIFWSAMPSGIWDRVNDVRAAIPEFEALRYFQTVCQAKNRGIFSDIAAKLESTEGLRELIAPAEKDKHSYLKGFRTSLMAENAIKKSLV